MSFADKIRSIPVWLVSGLIAVAVLAIGFYVWHESSKGVPDIKDREVHAGMYDFKKEAAAGNLGKRTPER